MAITADDVSLEDIVPVSLDFAVVESEQLPYVYHRNKSDRHQTELYFVILLFFW